MFLCSSGCGHNRGALVVGVHTLSLPICAAHRAIDRGTRQRGMIGAIVDLGIGLRRAVAIEQVESGPWTEPQALVPPMDDPELTFCDDAKLHMIDPSIVEARCRGSADQIGEGDAVR